MELIRIIGDNLIIGNPGFKPRGEQTFGFELNLRVRAIRTSKLPGGKKIGKCPEVVFKELDGNVNGQTIPDHIELNISRRESPDRELFLYPPA